MAAAKSAKAEKPLTLKDAIAQVHKDLDLRVGSMASIADDVAAFSTGNIGIDNAVGVGGLPRGRVTELYGPPSCGKSTTAMQCAASAQKQGENVLYMDYEHALDEVYAKAIGLDTDAETFLFSQPDSLEQGVNAARLLISTGSIGVVIWDSVAAMTPSALLDAETGKVTVALQARLMSDTLKVMVPLLHRTGTLAIFLNHQMELIDMSGRAKPGLPPRISTPGGRALKYYASVRLEYQPVGGVKGSTFDELTNGDAEGLTGTNVRVRVVKNKVASPFKQATVRVRYGKGFSNEWTGLQILIAHKKIINSSGYFYFDESRCPTLIHPDLSRQAAGSKRHYLQGEPRVLAFADTHPVWAAELVRLAQEAIAASSNPSELLVEQGEAVEDDEAADVASILEGQTDPDAEPSPEPALLTVQQLAEEAELATVGAPSPFGEDLLVGIDP